MIDKCPGSANLRTPTLKLKKCPECGRDVEIFSVDIQVKCDNCGFIIYNDIQSCLQWCKYAKQCVGKETYDRLLKKIKDGEKDG